MDRRLTAAGVMALPMCRRDIADYLGLTLETVSRTLSVLHKKGFLKFLGQTQREIVVLDPAGLAELARISHRVERIEAPNQRKFFCEKDFAMIRGAPRCRQSVAQNNLILEWWKAALWRRPLMLDW
jgi:DNA-binding MarR family transcriptional regulator